MADETVVDDALEHHVWVDLADGCRVGRSDESSDRGEVACVRMPRLVRSLHRPHCIVLEIDADPGSERFVEDEAAPPPPGRTCGAPYVEPSGTQPTADAKEVERSVRPMPVSRMNVPCSPSMVTGTVTKGPISVNGVGSGRATPRRSRLEDAAGADVGRRVPAGHRRDLHHVTGMW